MPAATKKATAKKAAPKSASDRRPAEKSKKSSAKSNVTPIKSSTDFAVEIWPLHEIKPYEQNARKIPEAAIEKVAKSLQAFGWRQPMVVDTEGVLIVGHARRLAAVHLGWTEGPVHIAKDLTPAQIRAYRLMDNRSHQETDWDADILGLELNELAGLDIDLNLTGFTLGELDQFMKGPEFDPVGEDEQGRLDQKKPIVCPSCGHEFTKD